MELLTQIFILRYGCNMAKYKLKIEFENIRELKETINWLQELEVLNKKAQLKKDEEALGEKKNDNKGD